MKTNLRIAICANHQPKPGERLLAVHPVSVVLAADAKPDAPLPTEIVWMPRGDHEISASTMSGSYWSGLVRCDELGSSVVVSAYNNARAAGYRTWLDENHDDSAATADVREMKWDPARGIVARVDWTPLGERLLRERQYCSFSPTFWVDWESGRVAGIVEGHALGGIVNAPAFGAAMPALIAARLGGDRCANPGVAASVNPAPGGSPGNHKSDTTMNREKMLKVLAALAVTVPADATDAQVTALYAQHIGAQPSADAAREIATLREQLTALQSSAAKPEEAAAIKAMKAQLDALVAAAKAAQTQRGLAAIQAAVDRGAIKADDQATRALLSDLFAQDEDRATKLLAAMPGKPSAAAVVVTPDVTQRSAAVEAQVLTASIADSLKGYQNERNHKKRAQIYAASIAPVLRDRSFILGPVLAANSLGSLAGDLVVQRALTLLKLSFPALTAISTDFSDEGAAYNQTVKTRLKTVPNAVDYVPGTGYTTQDATLTDVPVTINAHKGVPISFNANELASTNRDLFGEQAEGAHYALGKAFVDAIYALITVANFPAAQETISALADFNRGKVSAVATELYKRGVLDMGRFLLLSPEYFDKLQSDSSIVSYAAFQRPELITKFMLPEVAGMQPYMAVNLPTPAGENLVGFGGTPDSLAIATRVPSDYTQVLPASNNGSVGVVTNPDTGISVQLVQYVDHNLAAAFWRIAVMFGVAKGNAKCGQRLISAARA